MLSRALIRGNKYQFKCCPTRSLPAAQYTALTAFKCRWQFAALPEHREPHEQTQHQPTDASQAAAQTDGRQLQSTQSEASEPAATAAIAAGEAKTSTHAEAGLSNPAGLSSSSSRDEIGRDITSVQAARMLSIVALGLTVAGLAVGLWAEPIAAACLKLGSSSSSSHSTIASVLQPQAAAMVGCCGAAVMRAASLAWFVAEGVALGQGHTWRYQRINIGLAAAAALTALLQPLSFAAAQPLLLLAVLLAAAAVAAACGSVFLRQWRSNGVVFASAVGYGDWVSAIQATWMYFLRDVTTVTGLLMVLLTVAGVSCGLQVALGPCPSAGLPWLGGGSEDAGAASLQYLRRLLGVALVLAGLQGWALCECAATTARRITTSTAVKLVMVQQQEEQEWQEGRLVAPLHVSSRQFLLLHVCFFAAAVMQALWLWQAGGAAGAAAGTGVLHVNGGGDVLWALMYWNVLGSAAYFAAMVACIDYKVLWCWLLAVLNYLSGWVSWFAVILFVDWTWLTGVSRR